MDSKTTAIEETARAVLEHGGPDSLTDPHIAMEAMRRALALGATHGDIADEINRQRKKS